MNTSGDLPTSGDLELPQDLLADRQRAFEVLTRLHWDRVFGWARTRFRLECSAAEDVTQETYLTLHRKWDELDLRIDGSGSAVVLGEKWFREREIRRRERGRSSPGNGEAGAEVAKTLRLTSWLYGVLRIKVKQKQASEAGLRPLSELPEPVAPEKDGPDGRETREARTAEQEAEIEGLRRHIRSKSRRNKAADRQLTLMEVMKLGGRVGEVAEELGISAGAARSLKQQFTDRATAYFFELAERQARSDVPAQRRKGMKRLAAILSKEERKYLRRLIKEHPVPVVGSAQDLPHDTVQQGISRVLRTRMRDRCKLPELATIFHEIRAKCRYFTICFVIVIVELEIGLYAGRFGPVSDRAFELTMLHEAIVEGEWVRFAEHVYECLEAARQAARRRSPSSDECSSFQWWWECLDKIIESNRVLVEVARALRSQEYRRRGRSEPVLEIPIVVPGGLEDVRAKMPWIEKQYREPPHLSFMHREQWTHECFREARRRAETSGTTMNEVLADPGFSAWCDELADKIRTSWDPPDPESSDPDDCAAIGGS